MKPQEFINKVAPSAVKYGLSHNILPSILIAMSILESGYGQSTLGIKANNLFGIKATPDWKGKTIDIKTNEYDAKGKKHQVTAKFRAYDSYEGAFSDLCMKLSKGLSWEKHNRYQAIINEKDYKKATKVLYQNGYSTDPSYSSKLNKLIEQYNLIQYDKSATTSKKEDIKSVVHIKQMLVKNMNITNGTNNPCRYLAIHETANTAKGANALAHAKLQFNGNSRQASWHYIVDDKEIYQSYNDNVKCYHAGDGLGIGNTQSIGIEICVNSDGDYKKAVYNASELVKMLMKKHNIPITNVLPHKHFSGKNCPSNMLNGTKGITWNQFIEMCKGTTSTTSNTTKPKGDEDELKFSSPTLEKETLFSISSKAHREMIVKKAVEGGAHKSWLDKLKANQLTDGDIFGLAVKYIIDTSK